MSSFTPLPLAFKCVLPDGAQCQEQQPPIIFMHGLTCSKQHWRNIPQKIANETKRKVYVIDARNHGDSEWTDVFNFDANVDDLLHFMDYIGAPKAILVGHSMGGITGIKTAFRAPERVEKLVVEDMYTKKLPQEALDFVRKYISVLKAAIQEIPEATNEWTAKEFVANYISEKFMEVEGKEEIRADSHAIQLKQASNGRYILSANIDVLEKAMEDSETLMTENTGIFHGPVYFIYGALSPFLVGEEEQNIRKLFPSAEFIKIENATHDVHFDCLEDFTMSLLKFLLK